MVLLLLDLGHVKFFEVGQLIYIVDVFPLHHGAESNLKFLTFFVLRNNEQVLEIGIDLLLRQLWLLATFGVQAETRRAVGACQAIIAVFLIFHIF
jgi:hypothetical protein